MLPKMASVSLLMLSKTFGGKTTLSGSRSSSVF